MTQLQDALQNLSATIKVCMTDRPRPVALSKIAEKLTGNVAPLPDQATTYELQKRVSDLVLAGRTQDITRRDLRLSCTTINHPPLPPAKFEQIGNELLREVAAKRRRTPFYQLLGAYLASFDPQDAGTRWLATKLKVIAERWEWRENNMWEKRIKQFDLLDVDQAPRRLAIAILDNSGRPHDVLRDVGLDGGIDSQSKLASAAFKAACEIVPTLSTEKIATAQATLLSWNDDGKPNGRFPDGWLNICRACLETWKEREPSEHHKRLVLEKLQNWGGGDPRISVKKTMWSQVNDQAPVAYGVLMRWLTKASVLQFLEIVGRSLRSLDDKRMWADRRIFWTSYLDRKTGPRIEQAWVAFGADAAAVAEAVASQARDPSFRYFGRHNEESRGRQKSALIMLMGDKIVVEWSHTSKCNFWQIGQKAPTLFRANYPNGILYSAPVQIPHLGNWQKTFADALRR